MPVVERELSGFQLAAETLKAGGEGPLLSFTLVSSPTAVYKGFSYTITFPLANTYRVLLTGPGRPQPPHDNIRLRSQSLPFELSGLDAVACTAILRFPTSGDTAVGADEKRREIHLEWHDSIVLTVYEPTIGSGQVRILGDLPGRSYALTEQGVSRHWWIERENLHLGLGEKAAPIDLTGRSFVLHGSDSACYDAYEGDPLYKHTPYLISTPRGQFGKEQNSAYAIYHPTNSFGTWDLGRFHDDPWGYFKAYTQDFGGLEEWVMIGKGVKEVVRTFAELVGRPKLVGRDWLGYLASGMGLGESDHPIAQELLSTWPDLCKQHDIPCSAMHLSSGYTVGEDGNRYVFTMNKKRYPDFAGMVAHFHRAGIKVVPNIKPYMLQSHPHYPELYAQNALFHDPQTGKPVETRIWSSGVGVNGKGSWVDMTSEEGRSWWARGVKSLIEQGVDGMWNDNNEFYLHDDAYICKNQLPMQAISPVKGEASVGLMGRMINTEMMAKVSHDTLTAAHSDRRTYVLTRSGNVGTFKYACSTWSGDNETSWKNLRGSQAIQLQSSLSLMQSYGSDIGGFGGPLPNAELITRWVQLGVTHSRFCIHSFKPDKNDPSGAGATNTPWMYPEVLPVIRDAIKWRYKLLPYFNSLMWLSHLEAEPTNAPLFFGEFASDPLLYTQASLNGFDAWIGTGQLLSAPALFEGMLSREVYFPRSSANDQSIYFDLHAPFGQHKAGSTATIATPLDHMGLFAREGAVIPTGKPQNTVTQIRGPGRTTTDGVDVVLESEGGVVGLDDWRGVQIFPGKSGNYSGKWIEDDGISTTPAKAIIEVVYKGYEKQVEVQLRFAEWSFKPLWGDKVSVLLPIGDERTVKGCERLYHEGRTAWLVQVK